MNKLWSLGLALLLYLIIPSAQGQNTTFDTSIDRYADIPVIPSDDNSKFTVTYNKWYKVITNKILNQSYIVTFEGQQPSTDLVSGAIYVNSNNPQSTIGVTGSRSAYSYLENLGLQDRVRYSDNQQQVTSPCYNNLSNNNATTVIFDTVINGTSGSSTTKIVGFSPDETMTPLEQASWIMYISYFFDLESQAYHIYTNNIQTQYNCRKSNMANAGAQSIAITSYDRNQWSLQQQSSQYFSTLIRDAGMVPFNGTMDNLHEADFVIDVSPTDSPASDYSQWLQLVDSHDHNTQVFTNKKNVYRIDGLVNLNGALDWTERSPSRPDLAIQDIINVVYFSYDKSYHWTWLRNFAKGENPRSTTTAYPSCTDMAKIFAGGCKFGSYTPGDSNNNQGSSDNTTGGGNGLSTGAKIGTIVGVIVVVVGIGCGIGFFFLKKKRQENPERTFYKMDDV
ncbi:hypothetical protein BC941DRAFT_416734 [Chlamydoabsidia padenii]|nr:hypothetical protein BC941DRAFT_416734 [Chlamydoabsidia padenii]